MIRTSPPRPVDEVRELVGPAYVDRIRHMQRGQESRRAIPLILKPESEPSEILASGIQRLHNEKSSGRYHVKKITCRETENIETTGQSVGKP
jgi:hypothetical protein